MIYWDDQTSYAILKELLDDNQVILASGDTVLGLWGRTVKPVFDRLNDIKIRNDRPYLLVIGSVEKLPLFIDQPLDEKLLNLVQTCWPGPVTLIFKARADLPSFMTGVAGTIAVRIPDHQGLLQLLENYDALFSTSANLHGQTIPESMSMVDRSILQKVGAICLDKGEMEYSDNPSTILDCSQGMITVVRAGAFDVDSIYQLLD